MTLRMLSLKDVLSEVDVTANTLRLWIAEGKFPPPVYLPSGHPRWLEVDIVRWQMGLLTTPPANPVKRKKTAHLDAPRLTEAQSKKKPESA